MRPVTPIRPEVRRYTFRTPPDDFPAPRWVWWLVWTLSAIMASYVWAIVRLRRFRRRMT